MKRLMLLFLFLKRLLLLLLVWGCCTAPVLGQNKIERLKVTLSRGAFSDSFLLLFKTGGNDETDDQDAPKISDGHLSVAGLAAGGLKTSIEEKAYPTGLQVIDLYTRVYAAGTYTLGLQWAVEAKAELSVTLYDHVLELKTPINMQHYTYTFHMDTAHLGKTSRFSLLLDKRIQEVEPVVVSEQSLIAYPNPFTNLLYLQVKDFAALAELQLTDMLGRRLWRKTFKQVQPLDKLEIPVQQLTPGLYLLDWRDPANPKAATTLKIIKL
jgi:hypothetical protein